MRNRRLLAVLAVIGMSALATGAALATGSGDRSKAVERAIEGGRAKNVILIIGDGMGDHEITIGRNYLVGAAGRLAIDKVPLTGQMTTYSVLETNPAKPDYTSESASTATGRPVIRPPTDGSRPLPGRTRTSRRSSSSRSEPATEPATSLRAR